MRRALLLVPLLLVPLLLLAACKEEPGFDERYDAATKEIEARAEAIDADITAADGAEEKDARPAR